MCGGSKSAMILAMSLRRRPAINCQSSRSRRPAKSTVVNLPQCSASQTSGSTSAVSRTRPSKDSFEVLPEALRRCRGQGHPRTASPLEGRDHQGRVHATGGPRDMERCGRFGEADQCQKGSTRRCCVGLTIWFCAFQQCGLDFVRILCNVVPFGSICTCCVRRGALQHIENKGMRE